MWHAVQEWRACPSGAYRFGMPNGEIDRWSEVPYYQQLAAILRTQIERGELGPGQHLPSEAALMRRHRLARGTVRKALEVLRGEGLIQTVRQRGSKVLKRP